MKPSLLTGGMGASVSSDFWQFEVGKTLDEVVEAVDVVEDEVDMVGSLAGWTLWNALLDGWLVDMLEVSRVEIIDSAGMIRLLDGLYCL